MPDNCAAKKKRRFIDTEDDDNEELYKNMHRGPGSMGGKDFRKPRNARATLLRIMGYVVKSKLLIAAVLLMLLISTGCSLAASYFLKPVIDDYIVPNIAAAEKDWSGLAGQLLILAGLFVAGALANYGMGRTMMNIAQWGTNRMRRDLFSALQDLPLSYFDAHTHGELISRFSNDAENVQIALEQGLMQLVSGIISFTGTLVLMLILSWKMFLITLTAIAISLIIVGKVGGLSKIMFKKQQASLGRLNGYIEEMIEGVKVVKAFTYESRAKEEFAKLDKSYLDNAIIANFLALLPMPALASLMNVCYAVTAVAGGLMILSGGGFTLGSLGLYLNYTRHIAMPINMMSNQIVNLMSAVAGAERIFAVIDERKESDEGAVTLATADKGADGRLSETDGARRGDVWVWKIPSGEGFELREVRGDVRFENVSFSYVPEKPVLKNISVFARPGQKIAFVGSTGAGKTTITNLINRFYEIEEGRILFDGIDIKDIKKAALRRSLGMVLQDTNLFSGTVMENLRYGRLGATDEECIEAAKSANAHGFISRLPDGYQTEITGNGQNLSQGQRQLLAIARTAVAKHAVMILDEATSSIDTRTEKLIEKGMDTLMEGKTVFVIAHRLSTVRNSKAIAVIEHGEIIEKGSHEELLELGGRYHLLYTGQHELS